MERLAAALAGRYRLERQLGQGGMATVYLAENVKHNRKVADGKTFIVAKPVNSAADVIVALTWADQARRAWGARDRP